MQSIIKPCDFSYAWANTHLMTPSRVKWLGSPLQYVNGKVCFCTGQSYQQWDIVGSINELLSALPKSPEDRVKLVVFCFTISTANNFGHYANKAEAIPSSHRFIADLENIMFENFVTTWLTRINSNVCLSSRDRNKLRLYKTFKQKYSVENCCKMILPVRHRAAGFHCRVITGSLMRFY